MGDLYRFYDKDNRLLYVGMSLHAAKRASQHRRDKPWWNDVARMDVDHHDITEHELRRLESEAIYNDSPPHNGKRGRPPEGERVEFRLPAELLARVDQAAAEQGATRAHVVRQILADRYQ